MQGQLVDRPSQWRRTLRYVLLGVSGLAMSIASMQPQMGERFVATPRLGAEIMVAIDVSRSMLADDATPLPLPEHLRPTGQVIDTGCSFHLENAAGEAGFIDRRPTAMRVQTGLTSASSDPEPQKKTRSMPAGINWVIRSANSKAPLWPN